MYKFVIVVLLYSFSFSSCHIISLLINQDPYHQDIIYSHCIYTSGPHACMPPGRPHALSTVTVSIRQDPIPPGRPRDLSTVTVSTCQDPGPPCDLSTLTVPTRQDPVPPGRPRGLSTVTLPTRQDPVPPRTA